MTPINKIPGVATEATRALEFVVEIGLDRVVVEGDSKLVTQALKTKI